MRKNENRIIYPLLLMGVFLVFASSCNKDDANNNANNGGNGNVSAIPVLTTTEVTVIMQTTAKSGGDITSDGGFTVTARGVCWSKNTDPTIADYNTTDGTGAGIFISELTGLEPDTKYFVRAYATNSQGTGYGSTMTFQTLDGGSINTVVDADGNVYQTITIGSQVWMAENLKTTKYRDGSGIPPDPFHSTPGYTWYNFDSATHANNYGALYNWYAVNTGKLCPTGWHVPSDAEWNQLVDYLVAQGFPNQQDELNGASNALKSCRQVNSPLGGGCNTTEHPRWNESSPHHGFDEYGFSALPGGQYIQLNSEHLGRVGTWWTSTEGSFGAKRHSLWYDRGNITSGNMDRKSLLSVRCVRD